MMRMPCDDHGLDILDCASHPQHVARLPPHGLATIGRVTEEPTRNAPKLPCGVGHGYDALAFVCSSSPLQCSTHQSH